ncbi:restriction endonuclease subunit S [Fusobacterium polymorphum]|uniref:restriction endonuclease subunit S n=2 Tax=Fusobacterium TaxID=848 RepID=UPI0022E78EF4|nr:restriction endonuclease subunit S [Fusobacterium polymorphum]
MKIYKLKDISEFIRNGVTIKQDISSKEGIPITRIETISKGTIDFNKLGYANISKIEKYKEWLLKKGDILISHINSEKHLGKSAIYLDNNYDIIHGMNLLCIRVIDKKVFPEYLQLFFKTNQYKKQIKKITKKSVNQASFSVNDFKEILITVPDLNIQEKIIKKIKVLEKILENNKLKLAYLSELTKSLFTRMFGDIKSNDKNWKIYKFSEKLKISSGGTPSKANKIYWENGTISWIGSNMCNDEIITKNDGKFITEEGLKNSSAKIYKMNTVIVALVGATIGKTGLLKFETSTNQNIAALEIKNMDYSPEFLFFLLQNLYYKFTELGGDTFKMANLNFIKNLPLISPPIELQNKFTERVEKIEKLKFEIEKSIEEAQKLYNSLISKYFDN